MERFTEDEADRLYEDDYLERYERRSPIERPLPDKAVKEFIEYLRRLGKTGDELRNFFKDYSEENLLYCSKLVSLEEVRYVLLKGTTLYEFYHEYRKILFWQLTLYSEIMDCLPQENSRNKILSKFIAYIDEITEYILQEELIAFIEEIKQYLTCIDQPIKLKLFIDCVDAYYYLKKRKKGEETNNFCPDSLYEKIQDILTPMISAPKPFYSDENSEKMDQKICENEKVKPELPMDILSQKMSDSEIIGKLEEYGGELLDKAMEEKNECVYNFILRNAGVPLWPGETDEEFIEYVLKMEIRKGGNGDRVPPIKGEAIVRSSIHGQKNRIYEEDFSNKLKKAFWHRDDLVERILQESLLEDIEKVFFLIPIGTKKSFSKGWEILGKRQCNNDVHAYREIINAWGEHFPVTLLKKEVKNQNSACFWGVYYSENKYAFEALVVFLYKDGNVLNDPSFLNKKGIVSDPLMKVYFNSYCMFEKVYEQTIRLHELTKWHLKVMKSDEVISQSVLHWIENHEGDNESRPHDSLLYLETKLFWLRDGKEHRLLEYIPDNPDHVDIKIRNIIIEQPFKLPERGSVVKKCFNGVIRGVKVYVEDGKNSDAAWKYGWRDEIMETYKKFKQPEFERPPVRVFPEYADYLLDQTDDMFSTAVETAPYVKYKAFLTESRKLQIKICLKNGVIGQEEAEKLTALAESYDRNYYAWSDKEIKECLSPDTDSDKDSDKLDKINAILEPEFMVRIFEKSILWVIMHKDSELWLEAPWFGMQIFDKSYSDRPAIWAKHLIKIADKWDGSENMLKRVCIALGHLREPLGGKVPIKLRELAENPKNKNIREDINKQLSLFNHENFRRMHHQGNEEKRVKLCKEELIRGQNREVKK